MTDMRFLCVLPRLFGFVDDFRVLVSCLLLLLGCSCGAFVTRSGARFPAGRMDVKRERTLREDFDAHRVALNLRSPSHVVSTMTVPSALNAVR